MPPKPTELPTASVKPVLGSSGGVGVAGGVAGGVVGGLQSGELKGRLGLSAQGLQSGLFLGKLGLIAHTSALMVICF